MMQINLSLSVATVGFLRSIDGKEIVLSSTIENNHAYLLIYPQSPIYVYAIDDIFDDCAYDVVGGVDVQFGFDKDKPFKYDLGDYNLVLDNDLMFEVINKALIHKGLLDENNHETIRFSKELLSGINGVGAILNINDDDLVRIEDVEIIGNDNVDNEFLDWINNSYSFFIKKFDSNKITWQILLDELKSKKAILCPQSAFELVQVKNEYDCAYRDLRKYHNQITIPKDDLHKLEQLVNGGIVMLNEIINVDFENGGNLRTIIETMEKEIPIDVEMLNVSDNMIELNFHDYEDEV